MTVTPEQLLQCAKDLAGQGSEATARAAASRAYYAAYHACVEIYASTGSSNTGMHRAFISGLTKSPDTREKQLGYILDSIYQARIRADYKLGLSFGTNHVKPNLDAAERILTMLR